jgi:hypothetical protein
VNDEVVGNEMNILKENLHTIVQNAYANGLVTMDSDAEVDGHSHEVVEIRSVTMD